jgi:hypothetical protein
MWGIIADEKNPGRERWDQVIYTYIVISAKKCEMRVRGAVAVRAVRMRVRYDRSEVPINRNRRNPA